MKVNKALIDIDKYFNPYRHNSYIYDFKIHSNLNIKLNFNKKYYGDIKYYKDSYNVSMVSVVIRKRGSSLKAERVLYKGIKDINIIEQLYYVSAFKQMFLIKVTSLSIISEEYCQFNSNFSRPVLALIEKESYQYLNKLVHWTNFSNKEDVRNLSKVMFFNSVWKSELRCNIAKANNKIELLLDSLFYNGYLYDYIDCNTTIGDLEKLIVPVEISGLDVKPMITLASSIINYNNY